VNAFISGSAPSIVTSTWLVMGCSLAHAASATTDAPSETADEDLGKPASSATTPTAEAETRSSEASTNGDVRLTPVVAARGAGWEGMWSSGLPKGAAFDAARAEPALQAMIDSGVLPSGPTLVPGCGRGYAVAALAADKTRNVLGVDIAPTAVKEANLYLLGCPGARVEVADFFDRLPVDHASRYALGYDCTFLCAIPVDMRSAWATAWSRLLAPGGELVTLIFPLRTQGPDPADGAVGGGPPFALSLRLVERLLVPLGFELTSSEHVAQALLARGGREIIARWRAPLR